MRILASAAKHGVSESDALHAERTSFVTLEETMNPSFILKIGFSWNGRLVEVGVADPYTDDPRLIHAMPLREAFRRFLPPNLRKTR